MRTIINTSLLCLAFVLLKWVQVIMKRRIPLLLLLLGAAAGHAADRKVLV